jgi:hypothetical protein
MFKAILYKPAKGNGWVAKRKFAEKAYGLKMLADTAECWAGKIVEKKDDFLMNSDGDWLLIVEMA